MFTKNISIEIVKGKKVPLKETYIVFYKSKDKIRIIQKSVDESNNQSITLNFDECKRFINLLNFYLLKNKFKPYKDNMLIFEKD
ncbi:MAG: hypothetical protein ACFFDK_07965 [Promethearchaeota archaeon]